MTGWGEEAAALTGLAPVAHDSGTLPGKRAIAGGRRALRRDVPGSTGRGTSLRFFADKVIIAADASKLVIIANALCKNRQKWTGTTA